MPQINPINWILSANLAIVIVIIVSAVMFNSTISERVINTNNTSNNQNWSW